MDISIDNLSDGAVTGLLNAHLQEMYKYSPPESVHALDQEKMHDPSVTFWSARIDGELAGCGALKELSPTSGEIKSMKTAGVFLRKGVASQILEAILAEAKQRSYLDLSLETGSNEAFKPAIKMYEKYGFTECGPFGDYKPDPYSKFYTIAL
ncbi:MAG: GNAT family N-acetyltransferase [Thiolinea sp.]